MAGIADGMVEWQKWLHTYYLRYTPTTPTDTDDDDDDDDDTIIFYSIDNQLTMVTRKDTVGSGGASEGGEGRGGKPRGGGSVDNMVMAPGP